MHKIIHVKTASQYFHVPFCTVRCDYCDFYSMAGAWPDLRRRVISETCRQAEHYHEELGRPSIDTIFIGGGTPTAVPEPELAELLETIRIRLWDCDNPPVEWTVEANPETITPEILGRLSESGVTRLSVGVQSFDARILRTLGRNASREAVRRGLTFVAEEWGGALNIDLMTGVPGQTARHVEHDVREALACGADHVSLYELTVEPGTRLAVRIARGELRAPNNEDAACLWDRGAALLEDAGLRRYEVSNFAAPGSECRHNLRYWRMEPSVGCGPSAASTVPGAKGALRVTNPRNAGAFLCGSGSGWGAERELLSSYELFVEHMLMGMRLTEGVGRERLSRIFGRDPVDAGPRTVARWCERELLECSHDRIRLSPEGLSVLDQFLREYDAEASRFSWPAARWPDAG